MHITALDHLVLEVADVERSVQFYLALGLQPERLDSYRSGEVKFPSLRVSEDSLIDLFPPAMHSKPRGNGQNLNHFALVSDLPIERILQILAECEIPVEQQAEANFGARGFATSFYVRDPDGNRVELRTYRNASKRME